MHSIHIRGVDPEFVKKLKMEALERNQTMKDYVLEKLGYTEAGAPPRAVERPVTSGLTKSDEIPTPAKPIEPIWKNVKKKTL